MYDQDEQPTCTELARAGVVDFLTAAGLEPDPRALSTLVNILEALRTGRPVEVDVLFSAHLGHRVLAYGYEADAGLLLVRNTWGTDWGDDGDGVLDWEAPIIGAVAW